MKKRLISMLLAVLMVVSLFSGISVSAYADNSIINRCALMHDAGESQEMLLEMWNQIKLAR